jgi:hypothetical protein
MFAPNTDCPHCGNESDDYTVVRGAQAPSAGDVSVCLYCSCVSVFTGEGLVKRKPTAEELPVFMADSAVQEALARIDASRQ